MKPEQYKKRGIDLVGFWNPELGPVHGIPRAVKLFDSQLNPSKPSTLIILELVDSCLSITAKDEDDDAAMVETKAGDLVGVWAKPGMAAIKTLCGEPVFIDYERDEKGVPVTKKMKKKGMNAMKCFDVSSARNPMKVIPVIEDTRKESAGVNTLFAPGRRVSQSRPDNVPSQSDIEVPEPDDDDDIPF